MRLVAASLGTLALLLVAGCVQPVEPRKESSPLREALEAAAAWPPLHSVDKEGNLEPVDSIPGLTVSGQGYNLTYRFEPFSGEGRGYVRIVEFVSLELQVAEERVEIRIDSESDAPDRSGCFMDAMISTETAGHFYGILNQGAGSLDARPEARYFLLELDPRLSIEPAPRGTKGFLKENRSIMILAGIEADYAPDVGLWMHDVQMGGRHAVIEYPPAPLRCGDERSLGGTSADGLVVDGAAGIESPYGVSAYFESIGPSTMENVQSGRLEFEGTTHSLQPNMCVGFSSTAGGATQLELDRWYGQVRWILMGLPDYSNPVNVVEPFCPPSGTALHLGT